ncbi:MAG: transglycosylase SLT domain-containing protein, partial [Alphaproteobacteria bacterium]
MQLMPATASFITNDRSLLRERRDRLFDPELNLAIGQDYLAYLSTHETVGGDLVRLIAAYNGGPGNLAKWVAAIGDSEDPLLLIESIPVEETRLFVQRVLFDLWAYRMRLGERAHSLDALAAGESPLYTSATGAPAADHVRN